MGMLALKELFSQLDEHTDPVPLDLLTQRLEDLDVRTDDLEPFERFSQSHYQRNLVHRGPAYHALLLCWLNGQRSPIHDHRGSACAVRVIRGAATETLFAPGANGLIYATGSEVFSEGTVIGSQDSDMHQISNLQAAEADLVTLHIYSPPLFVMGRYSLTDARIGEFVDPIFEFAEGLGI